MEKPKENSTSLVTNTVPYKTTIVWKNTIGFLIVHLLALYALYPALTSEHRLKTGLWSSVFGYFGSAGITMGAHRLFTHRGYTASPVMRTMLLIWQTMAGQNCTYVWVRDHRLHHKYSDTDADPHNSKRGFFFSHIGWLMVRKHPDIIAKGKTIDMSDIEADPLIMFQKKYFLRLYFVIGFLIPIAVPCLVWGENVWNSFLICFILRQVFALHSAWTVNSLAHIWGTKPYNKNITPKENPLVVFITQGEGYHNYHHQFPWDYRAAEFGSGFNMSTVYIDLFAKLGWVSNRRTASKDLVRKTIEKHGDGSHTLWGFGDKDMGCELHKALAGDEYVEDLEVKEEYSPVETSVDDDDDIDERFSTAAEVVDDDNDDDDDDNDDNDDNDDYNVFVASESEDTAFFEETNRDTKELGEKDYEVKVSFKENSLSNRFEKGISKHTTYTSRQ